MIVSTKVFISLLHNNLVSKLPKNKFDSVNHISEFILQNQTKMLIADAHNHPEGSLFLELHASTKQIVKVIVFTLSHNMFYSLTFTNSGSQMSATS